MNFAYGGTGVFDTVYHLGPNLTNQIDIFETLIRKSVFNISDLESSISLVSVVGNDYSTYAARNNGSTDQEWLSFISTVVDQITVNLKRIRGLGVGKIAVVSIQPIGCLPNVTATNSFKQCIERDNSLGFFHGTFLQQAVAKLNIETKHSPFIILDLYSSFMSVLKNKESIKFEDPLKPCCVGISSAYGCGSVDESGAKKYVVCEDPKSAFFWDSFHPTHEGWLAVYSALKETLRKLL
ncbi:hypothetical protein CJ030_MR2G005657 [Morella rubra]|uniref:GDSL esterase/lipase n=1 Tax=Morella rubra TaxID=262757 RepID=A0A6A1WC92_9ROSI|nr:hypothetical protein CJ030_MR2G005657 [Morella rubra]